MRGDAGAVVSIDLDPPELSLPENVTFIQGDSIDPGTVSRVADLCAGKRTMVIADGNHAAAHVLQEMRAYGPMVSTGCYFIAEDGIVDVMEWEECTPGPRVAALKFVEESGDFVIDQSREKFVLTYCPSGFLKRVTA
jgi:cephalosporin hydroxylase